MTDTKTCYRCKVEKTIESFYRHKREKDGHLGICKRCFNLAAKNRAMAKEGRWLWTRRYQ